MVYTLTINRTIEYIGTVEIEAESKEDAERKYLNPDYRKGEYLIFDDEIDWDDVGAEYHIDSIEEKVNEERN